MIMTEYKESEVGSIPADWEIMKFKDVFDFLPNNTYAREYMTESNGFVHNIHYGDVLIRFGAVLDFEFDNVPFLDSSRTQYRTNALVHDGDIIIADTAEDETVGKAVEVKGLHGRRAVSGLHTMLCRPRNESLFYPGYLGYYINSSMYHDQLLPLIVGTKVSSISKTAILDTFVLIPPFTQQKYIAKALSEVDSLLCKQNEEIEKKRMIKEGLMQELLTGKKRLRGFSGKWETVKLNEIAEMSSGGTPSSKEVSFYGGDIPFLSISDMTSSGKYIFRTEKTITKLGLENSSARVFPPGTLMYAMYASLGKCSITNIEVAISQAILGFKLSPRIDKMFLYYHFCYIEESVKKIGQTGTQSNLSKQIVENFALELPEIDEQKAIGRVLSDIDLEISTIESMRDKYLLIKQGMMQQLLTGKTRL